MFAFSSLDKWPRICWRAPRVYFMHIPKTAGTSVEVILTRVYGRQKFRFISFRNLSSMEPRQLGAYRCWRSHAGPGLLPFLPQSGLRCFTLLRDPVEQMISHIYHIRRHLVEHPTRFEATYAQMMQPLLNADLRAWLAHPSTAYFDNFQTRQLGHAWDLAPCFKTGEYGRFKLKTLFPWLPTSLNDDAEMSQVLARACRQLDQMDVVGITERFAESLELICALLGIPIPQQLPGENIGTEKISVQTDYYRQQTPPDLIEQIEARNRYDRELYAYACDRFSEQLARHRARPQRVYSLVPRLPFAVQTGDKAVKVTRWVASQLARSRRVLASIRP